MGLDGGFPALSIGLISRHSEPIKIKACFVLPSTHMVIVSQTKFQSPRRLERTKIAAQRRLWMHVNLRGSLSIVG